VSARSAGESNEPRVWTHHGPATGPILSKVSLVVKLPEDLAARVEAAAAKRGVSAEEVVAEAVAAHLPSDDSDPLEAFIGSGSSGRSDLARRHREIRAELTGGHAARDL
jgi:hypothetical protein